MHYVPPSVAGRTSPPPDPRPSQSGGTRRREVFRGDYPQGGLGAAEAVCNTASGIHGMTISYPNSSTGAVGAPRQGVTTSKLGVVTVYPTLQWVVTFTIVEARIRQHRTR